MANVNDCCQGIFQDLVDAININFTPLELSIEKAPEELLSLSTLWLPITTDWAWLSMLILRDKSSDLMKGCGEPQMSWSMPVVVSTFGQASPSSPIILILIGFLYLLEGTKGNKACHLVGKKSLKQKNPWHSNSQNLSSRLFNIEWFNLHK